MADQTLKEIDSDKRANRSIWTVTLIVTALILVIALVSWLNLHIH